MDLNNYKTLYISVERSVIKRKYVLTIGLYWEDET